MISAILRLTKAEWRRPITRTAEMLAIFSLLSPSKLDQIIEQLYLLVYSRLPDAAELDIASRIFAEKETSRRQAAEDLLWALLNTPEFMFKD